MQHAIDIEMTITNGQLGVGWFCPEKMVDLPAAEQAMEELKNMLEKLVGKAKAWTET